MRELADKQNYLLWRWDFLDFFFFSFFLFLGRDSSSDEDDPLELDRLLRLCDFFLFFAFSLSGDFSFDTEGTGIAVDTVSGISY